MSELNTIIYSDENAEDTLMNADGYSELSIFMKMVIDYKEQDSIDDEDSYDIIVGAAILDAVVNGTGYRPKMKDYDEWIADQKKDTVEEYTKDVASVLKLVLTEKSDLYEHMQENKEYAAAINDIIERLEK